MIMAPTIQKWGNSQGVRLPKAILDDLNMSVGEEVEIYSENNTIIIRPAKQRKTIRELFAGYEGDYSPEIIDWGKPVGKEVW
jgi:antitoxin MazE